MSLTCISALQVGSLEGGVSLPNIMVGTLSAFAPFTYFSKCLDFSTFSWAEAKYHPTGTVKDASVTRLSFKIFWPLIYFVTCDIWHTNVVKHGCNLVRKTKKTVHSVQWLVLQRGSRFKSAANWGLDGIVLSVNRIKWGLILKSLADVTICSIYLHQFSKPEIKELCNYGLYVLPWLEDHICNM